MAGLAIVIYSDGSIVKHRLLVKLVYITVRNAPEYVGQQCQFEYQSIAHIFWVLWKIERQNFDKLDQIQVAKPLGCLWIDFGCLKIILSISFTA